MATTGRHTGRALGTVGAVLALLVTVGSACSDSGAGEEASAATTVTTRRPTTTTTVPTTTTASTVPPPPECEPVPPGTGPPGPLTGRPVERPGAELRPALVVKIDNYEPSARPQAGLTRADVVFEEKVEGPVSRFAAVFQSTSSEVGPVRSARSTDISLAAMLGRPLFAYSGANAGFQTLVDRAPLIDVGAGRNGAYRRAWDRPVPYNLWSSTDGLWAGQAALPPPALWTFRADGAPPPGGGRPVSEAGYHFGGYVTNVRWVWDPTTATFARWQNGTPHLDATWCQVRAENVILQVVPYVDSGARDVLGGVVPEAALGGEGQAWVLSGGQAVPATWRRWAPEVPTEYLGPDGSPIPLAPGRTWVALVPVDFPVSLA